jgi:hypothetical protein
MYGSEEKLEKKIIYSNKLYIKAPTYRYIFILQCLWNVISQHSLSNSLQQQSNTRLQTMFQLDLRIEIHSEKVNVLKFWILKKKLYNLKGKNDCERVGASVGCWRHLRNQFKEKLWNQMHIYIYIFIHSFIF